MKLLPILQQYLNLTPAWKGEDERLPIWVRKAVSKHRRRNNIWAGSYRKAEFNGIHWVYKFRWETEFDIISDIRVYSEFWVKERR